jgi:hypothetical protein
VTRALTGELRTLFSPTVASVRNFVSTGLIAFHFAYHLACKLFSAYHTSKQIGDFNVTCENSACNKVSIIP